MIVIRMRTGRKYYLPWLTLLAALILPATPARAVPNDAEALAAERRKLQTHFVALPVLKYTQLADMIRFTNHGGHLVCETPVLDGKEFPWSQFRAHLRELGDNGVTVVTLSKTRMLRGDRQEEIRTFNLTHYDFSEPDALITLTLTSQPDYFRLASIREIVGQKHTVDLIDQQGAMSRAQLIVDDQYTEPGRTRTIQPIAEKDFNVLVRKYREHVETQLRPLVARLGQESAFAPDPLVAWQVFGEQWRPDAAVSQRVDSLLPALSDSNFRQRDAALEKLRQFGRPGAAVLLRMDREGLSPEQNARIDDVLGPYEQLQPAEAAKLRQDVGFLLDCVYADDVALRGAAMNQLRQLAGVRFTFDATADNWVRATEVQKLRQSLAHRRAG